MFLSNEDKLNLWDAIYRCEGIDICIIDLDSNIKICNKNMASHLGYNINDIIDTSFKNIIYIKDIDQYEKHINNIILKTDLFNDFHIRYIHKNKKEYWVDQCMMLIEYDKKPYIFIRSFNIDKIKRKELLYTEISERYKIALDSSNIGLWIWDYKNDRLFWNDNMYKLYGILQEEVSNNAQEDFFKRIHKEDIKKIEKEVNSVIKREKDYNLEFKIFRKNDNELRDILACGKMYYSKKNDIDYMVGTNLDITTLKQQEQELISKNLQLKKSNEELEKFAFTVAHDIKESIRSIIGFIKLIKDLNEKKFCDTTKKYFEIICYNSNKLIKMVDDILSFSKVGIHKVSSEPVNITMIVDDIINSFKVSNSNVNINITYDDLPEIESNYTGIYQLFANLISNAIKFRKSNSVNIKIEYENKNYEHYFKVIDNGIGIGEKDIKNIFNIFYRAKQKNNKISGTGLGLTICKKIVDNHNGKIWVLSKKNEGSSFCFTINKNIAKKIVESF